MDYSRMLIGVVIGLIVGAINFYLMHAFVRLALKYAGHVRGILIVISSYFIRYLFIGLVVFYLMKRAETLISLTMLSVLGILMVLLAVWQQRKKAASGR